MMQIKKKYKIFKMLKKAMFYTSAAIALTLVIIVIYGTYTSYKYSDRMESIGTRIETVNFFIRNIEKDLNKGAYISGFRALLSFNQYITSNGSFLDNSNARFKELFLNGTLKQQPMPLMQGSTFTDWANKISVEADKIDIISNFTINDVQLNQTDPWSVTIGINITLNARDKRNTSSWVRERHLTTKVNIVGFEDPLYTVNSKGRVSNTIRIANNTNFVVGGDVTNLIAHANNSYYVYHNDSPSFLMRLEGNLGNSTVAGIESLVNLDKFQQQGLDLKDRSIVDFIYFGAQNTVNYRINKTPEWFKLDQDHLAFYQTQNVTI